MWDEDEGGVAIYQNGKSVGSIGTHSEFQGSAITGNATSLFVALQPGKTYGSGAVGRYNRATKYRDLVIQVSAATNQPRIDVVTAATAGSLLYASDFYGNRVRVFTTDGVWQRDISVSAPGALAVDGAGNVWVAQKSAGAIAGFSPAGALLNTIRMPAGSQPSALVFDAAAGQLLVGDEGPDQNIKRYSVGPARAGRHVRRAAAISTRRRASRAGRCAALHAHRRLGKDTGGNLYVLNNPWAAAGISAATARPTFTRTAAPAACGGRCSR